MSMGAVYFPLSTGFLLADYGFSHGEETPKPQAGTLQLPPVKRINQTIILIFLMLNALP